MKKVLIFGATSAIAQACARIWAERGAALFVVGRDAEKLNGLAADLVVRGAHAVFRHQMDANGVSSHASAVEAAVRALGGLDIALIAHGTLPDQAACEGDATLTLQEFSTNCTSVVALLTILANQFESQRGGSLGVITSVAGDRGRPSNYVYGSAKAGVSVFCEGMRVRLHRSGVSLTDIRPGFVATPMTQGLSLPALLVAQPDVVARRIVSGIERRADVLYVPAFWAIIMMLVRNIPNVLFRRLKL